MIKKAFKRVAQIVVALITRPLPPRVLARMLSFIAEAASRRRPPRDSLVMLLELEQHLFVMTGAEACRYGHGVHTKHRHTGYHEFFCNRLEPDETVIDIGCGNGALAYDMGKRGARVTGIDMSGDNIAAARSRFAHPNVEYVQGDVLQDLPQRRFRTAVMSNVLEHIEDRVGFLKAAQTRLQPGRWLLRVPMYERDWRVPLMQEVGVDYRLDGTHFIEFTREGFGSELRAAGLGITFLDIRWGEFWCEAVPQGGR